MIYPVQIKSFEVTHKMQLIMRVIKHGYEYALRTSENEDEIFLKKRSQKSKEQLLNEYKELKRQLG